MRELERFISSPPKNSDTDTEDSLLRQSSPECEFRRFEIIEIQTAMRSVIVPDNKFIERIELVSEPFVCMEPFFDFTVGLRMFHASQDWMYPLGFEIPFEFAIPIPVFIPSMSAKRCPL